MIAARPHVDGPLNDPLAAAIAACFDCLQHCTSCPDACAGEDNADEMGQCIRLCLDCADVCEVTGKLAIRRTGSHEGLIEAMLETCARACATCAEQRQSHAGTMEHCRICAETCGACRDAIGQL